MNALQNLSESLRHTALRIRQLLSYVLIFLWAMICPRAILAARLLSAESQLAVTKHRIELKKDSRPRLTLLTHQLPGRCFPTKQLRVQLTHTPAVGETGRAFPVSPPKETLRVPFLEKRSRGASPPRMHPHPHNLTRLCARLGGGC